MGHGQNLLNRLSNMFTKSNDSSLVQMLNAVGQQLDLADPEQFGLSLEFALSTATGSALDKHGRDWSVPRRNGEADDEYRKRIQAIIPICTTGPTVNAISQIVKNFTGVEPEIVEYGPDSFTMGVSPMGSFVFGDFDPFTFQVKVNNPNGVQYVKADLEAAVNQAKPARSSALFVHQGGV